MRVYAFDIQWDADGATGLPDNVILDVADDTDLENEVADILSDNFGFCVNSVNYSLTVPDRASACNG